MAGDVTRPVRVTRRPRLSFPLAAGIVIALWAPYAALNTLFPRPGASYALGLLLAGLALGALWLAGVGPRQCFVRPAPLSRSGAVLLAALTCFVPLALLAGRAQVWDWTGDLVYAPASGIAQELYFRSALLAALVRLCPGRPRLVVAAQALLFALWHARAYRVVPAGPASAVLVLVFVGGLLWGWQVLRDRTVLYAAAQHTIFLVVQ